MVGEDHFVAVEVNGPQHYFVNAPWVPNSWTTIRRAILEKEGWTVVSLHHRDLDEPGGVRSGVWNVLTQLGVETGGDVGLGETCSKAAGIGEKKCGE